MFLLGIDLGTSSIKVSVVEAETHKCIVSCQYPETEARIISPQAGWAEQSPDQWWDYIKKAILKCHASGNYDPKSIESIGISYQMHGLVLVDSKQKVLRNSIIWCDGRAVAIGDAAFEAISPDFCFSHLLNSPGNFTASKLAWIKENEPDIYNRIDKIMLPGDFISMKFTGNTTTTVSALSEGIFWDFQSNILSKEIISYFGFDRSFFPSLQNVFSDHGRVKQDVAERLSLKAGIPISYKAGDQLNNAFALNVLHPGEVAATAGTSGVIYGISDQPNYDKFSRINSFAHVNHNSDANRIGILLCINGAGIFNRWIRNISGSQMSYEDLNHIASRVSAGADGLKMIPFGNGPERMLKNKMVGAHIHHLDLNIHKTEHLVRAAQESIAFAFRYGMDIMRENGIDPAIIRAGKSNMFLSDVFTETFVNSTNVSVELYKTDGSVGAALGSGVGINYYKDPDEAFASRKPVQIVEPKAKSLYPSLYEEWKEVLDIHLTETRLKDLVNI